MKVFETQNLAGLGQGNILEIVRQMVCPKLEKSSGAGRYLLDTKRNHLHGPHDSEEGCEVSISGPPFYP